MSKTLPKSRRTPTRAARNYQRRVVAVFARIPIRLQRAVVKLLESAANEADR